MAAANMEVDRINKVRDLLAARLNDGNKSSTIFSFKEIDSVPLLGGRIGFKHTLETIKERTEGKISFEIALTPQMIVGGHHPNAGSVMEVFDQIVPPAVVPPQPMGYEVFVSDPSRLNEYFAIVIASNHAPKGQRLIEKSERGHYFYEGQKIDIATGTIYFDVFDILYLNADQNGFLSYEDIERQLRKRGREEKEGQERNDRIHNAITNEKQGLFHSAKINGQTFKNKTPKGEKLIASVRGQGLVFKNPSL